MSSSNVTALLQSAVASGVITQGAITGNLGSVVVAGAAGKALEDITASDVTLITLLVDASGSIHDRPLEAAVREGQTGLVDAFKGTKERDSVLMALWTFNGDANVVHGYLPVDEAVR